MRILLDQGTTDMRNKGNNALLEAAADRLREFWPDASLNVITFAPTLAKMYFPGVRTVSPYDLQPVQNRFDTILAFVPRVVWWMLFELREEIWHRWPALMPSQIRQALRSWLRARANPKPPIETEIEVEELGVAEKDQDRTVLREAISSYDLVVASGGGYMCDHAKSYLLNVFDRLDAAISQGIPTVMVGQGVGPMEDPGLRTRAKEILPLVDLIFVRERRVALPLLDSLGVPAERIMMTGDDAIEMTYSAHTHSWGTGIGVSVRVAPHTEVERRHIDILRSVLQQAARKRKAQLIALPISPAPHESDITHIRQLLAGYDNMSVGWRKLDTPLDTIKKAARCRIVVTGTFHGAVFALAQGIPVVAVAKSIEYFNKLSGLTDEFGPGCQVICLDDDQLPDTLHAAIENTWSSAEELRPALLEAAVRQIRLQHAAYERIHELVTSRSRTQVL